MSNRPDRELVEAFLDLKQRKNAILLAHYYQAPLLQDLADFVGDSLGLSQQAATTKADVIVFAGVVFMAETAKLLNPNCLVLVPEMGAGCSLVEGCPPERFTEFCKSYPDASVITYINSSVAVKAMSDVICTSSNAIRVVESIPSSQSIIFGPDRYLGRYVAQQTNRDLILWPGSCVVHENFDERRILELKKQYPLAQVIAHPECPDNILQHAVHIGSTSSLLKFTIDNSAKEYIVATEAGILHQMQNASPGKRFFPVHAKDSCSDSECPYMRMNTIENLYQCLYNESPVVNIPCDLQQRALAPLKRMLALG